MKEKLKQNLIVTAFGICLFAVLFHLSEVISFLNRILHLLQPVIVGAVLAFFIHVPVNGIEKWLVRLFQNAKKQPKVKHIQILSFLLALLCIGLVLTLVLTLLVPEIIHSARSLYAQLQELIPQWITWLDSQGAGTAGIEEFLAGLDLDRMLEGISNGLDAVLVNVADVLSSTVSLVVTAGFALIISFYITLSKERLCRHGRILVLAYWKPQWAEGLLRFCRMFTRSFTNFLTGQCAEAVILGCLMFFAFTIFKLPYGSLVGLLTAVCAIIPYVGAFLSCSISVLLTLLIQPALALRCLIVYLAVQFLENQFIYPRVVGGSVGLPPLYTLIAAMVGGKLFGIPGILFFIPLAAVAIELVKEDAAERLARRNIPVG